MSELRIAVEGCGHGTLHAIYASVERSCKEKGWPGVDLLIICGDFQAVRNAHDLNCVAMPAKYREMCDFHEYYSGTRRAPYLTIFVGGNHEASNYLFELYYGGWVADNIYYMGAANVLQLGPIKIAGMSGIWKGYNYNKLHHERLPYNEDDIKSIYHVRELDTRKLLQVKSKVDIGISHDWPRGVEWMGDSQDLFRRKAHLESDAREGKLGNTAARYVLDSLKPAWWFSGHLHCKYAAIVDHAAKTDSQPVLPHANGGKLNGKHEKINPNEIDLDLDDDDDDDDDETTVQQAPSSVALPVVQNEDAIDLDEDDEERTGEPASIQSSADHQLLDQSTPSDGLHTSITRFLALDKCLPGRDFQQLLDIPLPSGVDVHRPLRLSYDREWLAITRAFALAEPLLLGDPKFNAPRPKTAEQYRELIDEQKAWIQSISEADLAIPHNFTQTAPEYDGGNIHDRRYTQAAGGLKEYTNPQTAQFCSLLQIPNPFDLPEDERAERMLTGPKPSQSSFSAQDSQRSGGHRGGRGGFRRGRGGQASRGGHRGGWRGAR